MLRFRNPARAHKKAVPLPESSTIETRGSRYISPAKISDTMDGRSLSKSDSVPLVNGSSASNWVVQKFGGTSVGKFAFNIVDQVVIPSLLEHSVAVVCSARSSSTKAEGTTNRLLRAARDAENSQSQHYVSFVEAVRSEHVQVAQEQLKSNEIKSQLTTEINGECERVLKVLEAAQTLGEISPRCVDKVISTGEKLSCRLMAAFLQDRGIDAQYVDLAEVIDFPISNHGLDQEFYNNLAAALGKKIEECEGKVPVVTGYFGTIPGGLLDQVGRGYTDLCAALVAVGTHAKELQVWKEVDGIFTADPRKVPTARLLSAITPAEAAELTFYGSEVIHPFTMEQVIRARIPIRIKNVMNPKGDGTVIYPDSPAELEKTAPGHDPRLFRARSHSFMQRPKRPTAVTIKHKILVINVHSNKRSLSHGFFAGIFSVLDRWRLSIDLISTSEVHVSMALHSEMPLLNGVGRDEYQIIDDDLKGALRDLQAYGTVDIIPEMAILSLVGKQMKNMIGVAGRMFTTLGENNVNIEMISQGASEINISCVIEERDADRALNIIHTNMFTFLD
ncbi:Aspartate/glutamate/uridylate kinase [Aspergillus ambiguus]|uniref:aspartate kinase n=1 Tax=Aspergillus ambiguus TaxID=176160 RepID=UPI003CCCA67B